MAKPTIGRVEHGPEPEPDPDQMATDTLMTSVFSGISLIAATVILGTFGAIGLAAGRSVADILGAKVGLGIGLGLGMAGIAWMLRRYADRICARSTEPVPRGVDRVRRRTGDHHDDATFRRWPSRSTAHPGSCASTASATWFAVGPRCAASAPAQVGHELAVHRAIRH